MSMKSEKEIRERIKQLSELDSDKLGFCDSVNKGREIDVLRYVLGEREANEYEYMEDLVKVEGFNGNNNKR